MTVPTERLRLALNVGHGLQEQYARRYQRALDAILNTCEPHTHTPDADPREQTGSDFGRGYRAAMKALSETVIAAMGRHVIGDDDETS